MTTIYEDLQQCGSDPGQLLDQLIEYLREQRRATELFEAIKMRTRHSLGLPLVVLEGESSNSEDVEGQLEAGLLEACREAGTMLIEDGHLGQGWMYLRPTGDTELVKEMADKIEVTDDNYEEILQVLLHEGVDIRRGVDLMLQRQGTCNTITTYQQAIVSRPKPDRQAAAETLLQHFYDELVQCVRDDISRREAPAGDDESLLDMIEKRPQLLGEGGYHLDTTHVASVVQIASLVEQTPHLQMAYELTQYGKRLHHQFQYPGEEPYRDFYPAYLAFYSALLGRNVDEGLEYFRRKAETVDPMQHGTASIEAYVDLLDRTGHTLEAIAATTAMVPDGVPPQRIMPLMMQLADKVKTPDRDEAKQMVADYCKRRGDLLGYAATLARGNNTGV